MGLKRHSQQLGSRAEASIRENERSTTDGAILPRRLRLFSLCSFCWAGTTISLRAHLRQVAQSAAPPGSRNGTRRWARVLATGQGSQEARFRGLFGKTKGAKRAGAGKTACPSQECSSGLPQCSFVSPKLVWLTVIKTTAGCAVIISIN